MIYSKKNSFRQNKNAFKKPDFCINPNEYPELNINLIKKQDNNQDNKQDKQTCMNINLSQSQNQNFASAILKPIENNLDIDLLKPGWISITNTNVNNKLIYKFGPKINNNKNITNNDNENDVNLIMYNISKKIHENREKHKKQYNEINGAYAFEDFYQNNSIYDNILNNSGDNDLSNSDDEDKNEYEYENEYPNEK